MRALHVPLAPDAVERLAQRARVERRTPQDQAAVILEQALGIRDRAPEGRIDSAAPAEPQTMQEGEQR
jgi:hypothetical protein